MAVSLGPASIEGWQRVCAATAFWHLCLACVNGKMWFNHKKDVENTILFWGVSSHFLPTGNAQHVQKTQHLQHTVTELGKSCIKSSWRRSDTKSGDLLEKLHNIWQLFLLFVQNMEADNNWTVILWRYLRLSLSHFLSFLFHLSYLAMSFLYLELFTLYFLCILSGMGLG